MATHHHITPDTKILDDQGRDWAWAFVIFREIPGFSGYFLGSDSSAWSAKRRSAMECLRRLSPSVGSFGYLCLCLPRPDGKRWNSQTLHSLMLRTFLGPRPPKNVGCHNNGNPGDCRLINLRWDTQAGNLRDRVAHGTLRLGEKLHNAKLDAATVTEIRRLYPLIRNYSEIGRRFGVCHHTIRRIIQGLQWSHVK